MIVNGWQRPSERFCESGHCVEAAVGGAGVLVRASGAPETMVELTAGEFGAFVGAVKAGEYDHMIDSL